ncbi:hypothetical protein QTU96_001148 [Enterobacter asburiae]|nr:hypothetical protein [Enterobacter asburiae]
MHDYSPLLHAVIAVAMQCIFGISVGEWAAGGAIGCVWFIAREQTQAEYRWIAEFGHGKRINMPWWGGFDIRVWNVGSMLDFLVPVIVCSLVYACVVYRQA